ncbi:MAG TPA: methionyl-tRNA formyltransferase, partial [Gemmatimonadaceae bacterium]|nr:methionyl-tRNA formyltransferase [Gemmatimonadaceae bacterium]
ARSREQMRILFWGTPEFAVPPLEALLGEGFDVVGVVTQPDRPVGRTRALTPPPVKVVALREGIPVLQPERPRGEAFMTDLRTLGADLNVVVAYGHILPTVVIEQPPLGTINIHASLLPALRGAAPIETAIRRGMSETGITIMRMVLAMDAGPILHTARVPILADETGGELRNRLSEVGAQSLIEALALLELGQLPSSEQDATQATFAPKIERADARIDWSSSARDVANLIRAYDPRPAAFTTLHGVDVKCFGVRVHDAGSAAASPGTVLSIDADGMLVACGDGAVRITQVHPSGSRRQSVRDWAAGRGVAVHDVFGADQPVAS